MSHVNPLPLAHGGDLGAARLLFPDAPEPFIDLSTGVNPHPYPIPALGADSFLRLPEPAALARLSAVAAQAYGAPTGAHVVAAPGTQILLPYVAALVPRGKATVLGPTYSEHLRVARLVGHAATEVADPRQLGDADLAIVANPNNPDGRIVSKGGLLGLADDLRRHGGLLVVDEAFMDVGPAGTSVADAVMRGNIVVLRSFGKFFGHAGLRLGFAIAAPELGGRLDAWLGPWAVSGPAIAIGERALSDRAWANATREALQGEAGRLDELLIKAGLEVAGGTLLFRLARTPAAADLFHHLGRAGIWVRRFIERPTWLRFGLPGSEHAWDRLAAALAAFR
jgi:cobalamin biosynthesis protein CobC